MTTEHSDGRDDADFVEKKRSDRIYLSREFKIGREKDQGARFISRVFDDGARSTFDFVDGEVVLRATTNDKVQIKAVVTTDEKRIQHLTLQSFRLYKKEGWRPNEQYGINLYGSEIRRLLEFIQLVTKLDVSTAGKLRIDESALQQLDIDDAARAWISRNPDALRELVSTQITPRDVVSVAYRRKQVEVFERLLTDAAYFDGLASKHYGGREEALWQAFFEKNRWIFGYGLFHLSAEGFTGERLEQIVAGATIASHGKRVDGLLRSRGRLNALCLVEIKRHRTRLLAQNSYRPGSWQPSAELSGAVAQTISTVDGAEREFGRHFAHADNDGNPTGEEAIVARPRSVIVCGSLDEFCTDRGVNHEKFRSFELYRRHLVAPDVVTFDELLERARLVVESVDDPA